MRILVRVMVRVRVKVRVRVNVRSKGALGAEPTAVQFSPQRAEWSTQERVPDSISVWFPRPDKCMGHPFCRPQESSRSIVVVLFK